MAEQLGEAVLLLRTDDAQFERGVAGAEGKARVLGAQLDRTSTSSKKLAVELTGTGRAAVAAGAQFQRGGQQVTQSAGAQRAGMQQLSMQLNDMSTMFALGAKPMQIFASQGGQVLQAIQLMTGGSKGLAGFLAGPWGMAIMTATIVLTPLVAKLFEGEQAMKELELASSGLADAQSVLGDMFDLVTGKIKDQSNALRLNAQMMMLNLQAESMRSAAAAREASISAGMPSWSRFARHLGTMGGQGAPQFPTGRTLAKSKFDAIIKAPTGEEAARLGFAANEWARNADFSGLDISREDFAQGIAEAVSAKLKGETAAGMERTLRDGVLDPMFREAGRATRPRKPPKGPKDRTAQIAEQQAREIARLEEEELRAKLDLATDAGERAALQEDLLHHERNERERQIEADADLNEAQKAAQLAYIERLYGKEVRNTDGTITVEGGRSLLGQQLDREAREREMALANDALARQAAALDAQAGITTSLEARDRLEQRALEIQQQIERNLLEQEIANGRVADADQARALLAERQAAQRTGMLRSQRGPLERFRDAMREEAENIDQAVEDIQVRGLERLNDELVDAILNAKSLGEAFSNVAEQIVRDLLRIAIQRALIEPLANLLMPSGGGGGIFGFLGKVLGVAGAASGAAGAAGGGPANLLDGTPFGGGRAMGGPISAGTAYLVGEDGEEVIVPREDAHVISNAELRAGAGPGGKSVVELRVRKGELFEAEVVQISGDVAVRTLTEAAPVLTEAAVSETARRLTRPRM